MIIKGVRGAITVEENTEFAIKKATIELISQLIKKNSITESQVSHIFFTMTKDLDAAYPAKFVRTEIGWNKTAMMCMPELYVRRSLPKCLRVMIVLNCLEGFVPKYVYLKGAQNLRG